MLEDATTTPTGTTAAAESTPTSKIPTIFELCNNAAMASRLSEEAVKYIDAVVGAVNDPNVECITVTTERIEARVFANRKTRAAITLMFSETYQKTQTKDAPPADCWRYILPKFQKENPEYPYILPTVLVTPADYAKAKQMAVYIQSCFKTQGGNTQLMTRESFAGAKLSVITNLNEVRDFVRRNSPHAVPARDDYGILICLNVPTGKKNTYGQMIEESRPIMAVTGYTRFLSPLQSGITKNIPISMITDIVSIIPNKMMLSLALPLAVDAFVMQGMCFNPYKNFMDKNAPNLGYMFADAATGKLEEVRDIQKFTNLIQTGFTQPFFGIDITEGRARLVGIDNYVHDMVAAVSELNAFLASKTNGLNLDGRAATAIPPFYNFIGTYSDNGEERDTREIDYLKLISISPNVNSYTNFLRQDIRNPDAQINDICTIYSADRVCPLYISTSVIFNAQLINAMSAAIRELVTINYDQPQNTMLNLQPLLQANTVFNQFQQFQTGNAGTAMNYYNGGGYGTAFPY